MKILLLANSAQGLLSFRRELVEAMLHNGYNVIISVPVSLFDEEIKALADKYIPTAIDRRGINLIKDFRLLMHYNKIIIAEKPDVVLGYTIKPNIYGGFVCRMNGIPFIANITGLGTAVEKSGFLQKFLILLYKISLKGTKCIFFQNDANKTFFENHHLGFSNNRLIPGSGVNLNKFSFQDYPTQSTLKFIFISRILKEKGIDDFLYVAKTIKSRHPNTRFLVLGNYDDEKYKQLIEKYSSEEIIEYYGNQKDVRPFLKEIHCLIHPSFYPEGMSNVLLEAEASGRPVITTRRFGCKETVEDHVTGYIVDEHDPEQLLETVEEFIRLPSDSKRQMGKNARHRMEQLFDRNIVVNAYIEEINKCCR